MPCKHITADMDGTSSNPSSQVLVDGGSASASEVTWAGLFRCNSTPSPFQSLAKVLAVALRGNCRAPLLGSKTFGKAEMC